jgi:hypothetical protein
LVTWFHCSWAVVRQNITVGSLWKNKATHLILARNQREKEGWGQGICFKGTLP